jgi:hypothetical protein
MTLSDSFSIGLLELEFERYMDQLCGQLGHADRRVGFVEYSRGLMLPIDRKSVEPLAAHSDPWNVSAKHQSLHHMVAKSDWSDEAVLGAVRKWASPALKLEDGCFWIVDDTGFPKKGRHSVGVARQYCGQLGKQDNCQVAVSLSLASERGSLPIAFRLYLPEEWVADKGASREGGRAGRHRLCDQAVDCCGADSSGEGCRRAGGCRAGRCGLRQQHRLSREFERTRAEVLRRSAAEHDGVDRQAWAAAPEDQEVWPRLPGDTAAPCSRA